MRYLSRHQAVKFLRYRVKFQDKSIKINGKYLKRLNEECRLLPKKHGLFGPKYSKDQLLHYVDEVRPR